VIHGDIGGDTVASIIQVGTKWRALIRRKGFKSACKTFAKKSQAEAWARRVEADMDEGRGPSDVETSALTVGDCIIKYRELRDSSLRPISLYANEHYILNRLTAELGHLVVARMVPEDLVGYARMRRDDGVNGWTTNTEVSKLGTVLRFAAAAYGVTLPDVVRAARPLLNHLQLISTGIKRARRPEGDELGRVLAAVERKRGLIYAQAIQFAVGSTMRRSELCRALKSELDHERRMLLIRDRKHPRMKRGNDQWIPLLDDAWAVVEARLAANDPDPRLFPIEPGTLSKYFLEACRGEGIENLRLHDMRHEGASKLFEEGLPIEQVALVTGHKDWRALKIYTNLQPQNVRSTLDELRAQREAAKAIKRASGSGARVDQPDQAEE
jgi:integrase